MIKNNSSWRLSLLNASKKSKISIKDKIFAHLETWRLYTIIWCGLVSLAGACISFKEFPSLKIAALATFVPMMGWVAGLYLSDYLDRKLDIIQKPHRPIPSGRIKPKEALVVGGAFAIVGFVLSFLLGIINILLVFFVAALVLTYAKISKSHGISGNLNRGFVTVAAFFYGVFSTNQSIQTIPIYIFLLSLVFLFHDTNSNLVGAIRDMGGDKKGGYLTIPVKYGLKKSILLSTLLSIVWMSLIISIPIYFNFLKQEFYFILIVDFLIILAFYFYLFKSTTSYSREKGLKFHEFFVIERIVLASALIFGIAELHIAIVIIIVALIVTITSQNMLRKRYEFMETAQ